MYLATRDRVRELELEDIARRYEAETSIVRTEIVTTSTRLDADEGSAGSSSSPADAQLLSQIQPCNIYPLVFNAALLMIVLRYIQPRARRKLSVDCDRDHSGW